MAQLNAYLIFDGNCGDAMRFYERTLGGKLDLMTFGNSPMAAQMPPGTAERIIHARLTFDGGTLMASDSMPDQPVGEMKGFSLALHFPKGSDEAKRVFESLAEGGKVTMPLDKTFWAESFGMLVDRFGTPWMVNVEMASA